MYHNSSQTTMQPTPINQGHITHLPLLPKSSLCLKGSALKGGYCYNHDLLQPSPHIPEPTSSFSISNTYSQSCLITPDLIRLNLIACIYLSLVLVPCLSLPHIYYPTSILFPLSDSLSSSPLLTLYHLTLNCLPFYPRYIFCSSPYI